MRKYCLIKYLWAALLLGITPGATLEGVVVWNGNVTADALASVDPVISITGNVTIGDGVTSNVHVVADTADMSVTPTANFTISPDPAAASAALNFYANAGFTITVDLSAASLDFTGDDSQFLVTFSGAGNLRFNIGDGQHVGFTNIVADGPGATFLVNMDTTTNTPLPQDVIFDRSSNAGDGDATILVGQNSMIGFMGTDTALITQAATIGFDATNNVANSGRLVLNILSGGSVVMQGYDNNAVAPTDVLYADIDFETLAGNRGNFQTITQGGGAWSGFLVLNENTILPSFRSNPWCEDQEANPVGIQPGFVLGVNGQLIVSTDTYFDYVGASTNVTPTPAIPQDVLAELQVNCVDPLVNQVVKDRNPSAFLVDGPADPCDTTNVPLITLQDTSKIYFRSAVNCLGIVQNDLDAPFPFTVDIPHQFKTVQGNGSIVFDVEGTLNVVGEGEDTNTAINILSLFEEDTGGSVLIEGSEVTFKLRPDPWARVSEVGTLYEYGKACFMINGRMNLTNTRLQHTDEIHEIYEKNIIAQSEPTYIGGESFRLCQDRPRPNIVYYNSWFLLHTSAAFTGVDQQTLSIGADGVGESANNSFLAFYQNGFCVDQGTGRSFILGTNIGALASDLGTIIDRDAHFDIFQEFEQSAEFANTNTIVTLPNNNKVTEGLPADQTELETQYSEHSFFLGHGTNVSIGTPADLGVDPCTGDLFDLTALNTLLVDGSFIAFETQGGILNQPNTSVETGEGGIFVDNQGVFSLTAANRMTLATMVGIGFNGVVNLPERQITVKELVGVTRSNLDLSDPAQLTIVAPGAVISDFTLDWKYTIKDTCPATETPAYIPYTAPAVPSACASVPVVAANMTSVPSIEGTVNQFQVYNSRLGDPATIRVDGGLVRELLFFGSSPDSGVAPVGILITENNAIVGLGSSGRNADSPHADIVLGINGITLMPNGNSQIRLNEDVFINNVCQIVTGTSFGVDGANQLLITSAVPKEIRVKAGGVLDLSQIDTADKEVVIGGKVTLVFEPGSTFVLGGGAFTITDQAQVIAEPYVNPAFVGTTLTDTDSFRVRWGGTGTILFEEGSLLSIARGALVGIESIGTLGSNAQTTFDCPVVTNLNILLEDAANIYIGSDEDFGGGLQIGNTTDVDGGAVSASFVINGPFAQMEINSQGLLGLGVGQINKPEGTFDSGAPNNWLVAPLFNVVATSITVTEGTFKHNNIFAGDSGEAALFAIGAASTGHTFAMNTINPTGARVLGGGNLVQISGETAPTVLTTDGVINGNLSASILASRPTLDDPSKTVPAFPTTATNLFNYLKANPFASQITKHAQAAENHLGVVTMGYINGTTIVRKAVIGVRSIDGTFGSPTRSLEVGAVGMALSTNGDPTAYVIRP